MDNLNQLLIKYYNNYKSGKKILKTDKEKAYDYFKNSLSILENLKKKYPNKINKELIEESENECLKYLNLTVETVCNSDKPNNIKLDDLYNSLLEGNLELIKNLKYNEINFKEIVNNENLLHLAIKLGDTTFLKYAFKIGARIDTTNNLGYTLLETACFEKDPNIIEFLIQYGANMKKHLFFRDGEKKFNNNNDSIDICIILKYILSYENEEEIINNKIFNKFKILKNLINIKENINLNNYTYKDLLKCLYILLNKISEESALCYLDIILEELTFVLENKLGCPPNKLEIICISLVPFIDYQFNLTIDWIISLELKYLLINLIKKKKINNNLNIKKELIDILWNIYIKDQIIQEDYLGCLISQWITKIKV
jgi:ankyrin repeat protein